MPNDLAPTALGKDGPVGTHRAFGVEPGRRSPYELRQARYQRLGEVAATEADRVARGEGRPVSLLDVGVGQGRSLRYMTPHMVDAELDLTGVDVFPCGTDEVYRSSDWRLLDRDLEEGLPDLEDDAYDIVICEQVLEHLHRYDRTLMDLERVVRPGGMVIVGVPIFPPGLHRLRAPLVRLEERVRGPRNRKHVQAWSLRAFLRDLRLLRSLKVEDVRGFRVVSGGLLRPLEFKRWWWRLNRKLGEWLPGLCVEVQVLLRASPRRRRPGP